MSNFNKFLSKQDLQREQTKNKNNISNIKEQINENNFLQIIRDNYKLKSVISTLFGVQIDFYQKPDKDELKELIKREFKIKDKSIWIDF